MPSAVAAIPAAPPQEAEAHFAAGFRFETDCWDVHDATGREPDFVLLDVRVAGPVRPRPRTWGNQPAARQDRRVEDGGLARRYPFRDLLRRPALQRRRARRPALGRLGRPVKIMAGGITGWLDEGFALESATAADAAAANG